MTITVCVRFAPPDQALPCHVSNGEQIAGVANDGTCELPWVRDRHRFIFVIPPDGYRSVGRWWRSNSEFTSGTARMPQFLLRRHRTKISEDFSFLHVTDFHVVEQPQEQPARHGLSRAEQIDFPRAQRLRNALLALIAAAPEAEFIAATGDLTDNGDEASLRSVAEVFNSLPIPVFPIFGGHDGNVELSASGSGQYNVNSWTQHLAPPYYSWHWGGRHFISFVSETTKYLDPITRQMHESFIAEDLRLFARDRRTIVCSHKHPYPWNVGIFREYRVVGWFHGHFHSNRVMHDGGIRVFSTGTPAFGCLDGNVSPARIVNVTPNGSPTAPLLVRFKRRTDDSARGGLAIRWTSNFTRLSRLAKPHASSDRVYCAVVDDGAGTDGGVACFALQTGEMIWFAKLGDSVEAPVRIVDNRVLAVTQIGGIACLNASDGSILWRQALPDPHDRWIYSPPLVVADSLVVGTTSALACVSLRDGEKRWEFRDPRKTSDAFGQFQSPLVREGKLFLAGYRTSSYLLDVSSGKVLRENSDDRDIRFTSRVYPHDRLYVIGDGTGGLSCYEIESGQRLWRQHISSNMITSAFVPFCGGWLGGTADGLVRCAADSGRVVASRQFGDDVGAFVAYRNVARSCSGTPCVDRDIAWVASGDGYINVVGPGESLEVIDRIAMDAPILSPLVMTPDNDGVLGVSADGALCRIQHL